MQDKISLQLHRGKFTPVSSGGSFILKPIPGNINLQHIEAVPANEHLTMQLAGQVFDIKTPACALVDLADGEPAYIVRRFDQHANGKKRLQEDFCQLANRSEDTHGQNYKYDATQEETGRILKRFSTVSLKTNAQIHHNPSCEPHILSFPFSCSFSKILLL